MDEPTSVLTPQAVEKLFETLRQTRRRGLQHPLHQPQAGRDPAACATRATVLRARQGDRHLRSRAAKAPPSLARMMIGADLPACQHRAARRSGGRGPAGVDRAVAAVRRSVRHLALTTSISRCVPARSSASPAFPATGSRSCWPRCRARRPSLKRAAILHRRRSDAGTLDRRRQRRALGLAFVPEERLGRGAVPEMSLAENALLTASRTGHGAARLDPLRRVRGFRRATASRRSTCVAAGRDAGRAQPVRRQSAEVHRRPRDPAAAATC